VQCFGEVKEDRRRAGRAEGRGELARDVSGLAEAGNDQPFLAAEDQIGGADEAVVDAVGQRVQRGRIFAEDAAREIEIETRFPAGARCRTDGPVPSSGMATPVPAPAPNRIDTAAQTTRSRLSRPASPL